MDKNIAARSPLDESEAFFVVKPLHFASLFTHVTPTPFAGKPCSLNPKAKPKAPLQLQQTAKFRPRGIIPKRISLSTYLYKQICRFKESTCSRRSCKTGTAREPRGRRLSARDPSRQMPTPVTAALSVEDENSSAMHPPTETDRKS